MWLACFIRQEIERSLGKPTDNAHYADYLILAGEMGRFGLSCDAGEWFQCLKNDVIFTNITVG